MDRASLTDDAQYCIGKKDFGNQNTKTLEDEDKKAKGTIAVEVKKIVQNENDNF